MKEQKNKTKILLGWTISLGRKSSFFIRFGENSRYGIAYYIYYNRIINKFSYWNWYDNRT